jgi:hypothetical protein
MSPIDINTDLGRELIGDCVRFAEGLLTEAAIRKKYRFDDDAWEALGSNDELIEKIEAEKLRRIRDGSSKREKAQLLVVKAPDIVAKIMNDDSANARHRIDSAKVLNDFASNGPGQNAPASDRFVITINLGADHVERYSKSLKSDVNDVDPFNDVDGDVIAAIANKRKDDDGNGNAL